MAMGHVMMMLKSVMITPRPITPLILVQIEELARRLVLSVSQF
jgi:hypothetical protein